MELSLAEVRQATDAEWLGPAPGLIKRASGWSIDSRTIAPGDVFFAIRGDRFDGHAFVKAAVERGALAAGGQVRFHAPAIRPGQPVVQVPGNVFPNELAAHSSL